MFILVILVVLLYIAGWTSGCIAAVAVDDEPLTGREIARIFFVWWTLPLVYLWADRQDRKAVAAQEKIAYHQLISDIEEDDAAEQAEAERGDPPRTYVRPKAPWQEGE